MVKDNKQEEELSVDDLHAAAKAFNLPPLETGTVRLWVKHYQNSRLIPHSPIHGLAAIKKNQAGTNKVASRPPQVPARFQH